MPQRTAPLSPFLNVVPLHAIRHQWSAKQEICGGVSGTCVLWLVEQGSVKVEAGQRHWALGAGDAFLFSLAGERRVFTPDGAQWLSLSLRATIYDVLELLPLLPLPALWHPEEAEFDALRTNCETIVHEWAGDRSHDARTFANFLHRQRQDPLDNEATRAVLCEGHARALFALLWRQIAPQTLEQTVGGQFPLWMPLAFSRMRDNPALGVEELARAIGLSRRHLSREWQKYFGASPREFLNRRRLEAARQLLQATDFPLLDIARQSGFVELSHFNRTFKSTFGVPPETYRKQTRSQLGVI
jgi:AraC-like DNA-binding protein